jgi:hypothetical protein
LFHWDCVHDRGVRRNVGRLEVHFSTVGLHYWVRSFGWCPSKREYAAVGFFVGHIFTPVYSSGALLSTAMACANLAAVAVQGGDFGCLLNTTAVVSTAIPSWTADGTLWDLLSAVATAATIVPFLPYADAALFTSWTGSAMPRNSAFR